MLASLFHVGQCISMLASLSPCWPVYVARSTSRVNRRRGTQGPISPAGSAEHGLRGGFPLFEHCRRTCSAPRLPQPRGLGNDLLSWWTKPVLVDKARLGGQSQGAPGELARCQAFVGRQGQQPSRSRHRNGLGANMRRLNLIVLLRVGRAASACPRTRERWLA